MPEESIRPAGGLEAVLAEAEGQLSSASFVNLLIGEKWRATPGHYLAYGIHDQYAYNKYHRIIMLQPETFIARPSRHTISLPMNDAARRRETVGNGAAKRRQCAASGRRKCALSLISAISTARASCDSARLYQLSDACIFFECCCMARSRGNLSRAKRHIAAL